MKRLLTLLLISLITLTGSATLLPSSAQAAYKNPAKDAAECTDRYDGNTVTSSALESLKQGKDKACFNRTQGNCIGDPINKQATTYKITCKSAKSNNTTNGLNEDGSVADPTAPTAQDPALQAKCDKNSCPIIAKYINPIIKLLTVLVGIAIVLGIIIGGIQVSTSAGDPQKAANGKNHIRNAIIAAVAYLFLFGLLNFIIPGGVR